MQYHGSVSQETKGTVAKPAESLIRPGFED